MIHYPASVIRNARHLIELGEAVLAGKPIERKRKGTAHSHVDFYWESIDHDLELFSKTCSTYRVSRNQQLELQKEPAMKRETEGSVPLRAPEPGRTWSPSANWDGDMFYLSLCCSIDNPTFTRAEAARIHEALERFLGIQPMKGTRPMTPQRAKELAPIIAAYGEGKTIQYRQDSRFQWNDYPNDNPHSSPTFTASGEYRIKPEPTWRPWKLEEIPAGAMVTCAHATVANQDGRDFLIIGAVIPTGIAVPMLKTTRWFPNAESIAHDTLDQMPGLRKWYWPNEPHILRPVGVLEEPK